MGYLNRSRPGTLLVIFQYHSLVHLRPHSDHYPRYYAASRDFQIEIEKYKPVLILFLGYSGVPWTILFVHHIVNEPDERQ